MGIGVLIIGGIVSSIVKHQLGAPDKGMGSVGPWRRSWEDGYLAEVVTDIAQVAWGVWGRHARQFS